MGGKPIPFSFMPPLVSDLWFSFDPKQDDKDLLQLEQEVLAQLESVESKHKNLEPIGNPEIEDESSENENESESHGDSLPILPSPIHFGLNLNQNPTVDNRFHMRNYLDDDPVADEDHDPASGEEEEDNHQYEDGEDSDNEMNDLDHVTPPRNLNDSN